MALNVLIVEDEQSAARLLAGIAQEAGLSSRTTASGVEAQRMCAEAAAAGTPFCVAILDLVLAESDGFQFATAARLATWGASLPLIVVSGVYKQLPAEFAAKVQPAAFLAKPFEPAALRATLAKLTGAQAGTTLEGQIAAKPVAAVLVDLLRGRATGLLSCSHDGLRRVVTVQQGMIRFAQSNLKSETVGAPQIAAGLIKQTSFDRAVALARQQNVPLHEALANARVLTPEQLKAALKQQTADVCIGAISLREGDYRFDAKPAEAISTTPDVRQSPVPLILEAAKRAGATGANAARQWLEQRSQERIARTPDLDRETFSLKASWPGEGVTALASSGRTVGEVLARAKEAELPLLHHLCLSGLLALTGRPKAAAKAAPAAAAPGEEDRGKTFNAQETQARRMLFGESDHLRDASHYELLGVAETATPEDVKRAYIAAARRYHSDAFSGLDLGSARRVAEELFARVNEANAVLSDKQKRAEYDVFLDRKKKGLPTDVAAILRAEGLFQKGEAFFKMGRFEEGEAQFREAIGLNDSEAEFHAYLGMSIFKRTGKAEDGLSHIDRALELDARLHSANLFGAHMLEAKGDLDGARSLLRKAIEKDPEFAQARDELRRLRSKPATEGKGGFLSRLLKK